MHETLRNGWHRVDCTSERTLPVDDRKQNGTSKSYQGMGDTTILLASGWGMVMKKAK